MTAPFVAEVLKLPNRGDFCIGGTVDRVHQLVMLVRGNLEVLTVPMTDFKPTADGVVPDFSDFEVIDFGHAVRFGKYEASFDAILYGNVGVTQNDLCAALAMATEFRLHSNPLLGPILYRTPVSRITSWHLLTADGNHFGTLDSLFDAALQWGADPDRVALLRRVLGTTV